jgi:hypothetical protein
MAPLRDAASNLALNITSLRPVLSMRLMLAAELLPIAMIALANLGDELLSEATMVASTEETACPIVTPKAALAVPFFVKPSLLGGWRRIRGGLLRTACGVGQSVVSGGFLAVFLVVDKVPPLRKMSAQVLDHRSGQGERNIRPAHAGALSSVELIVFPVRDVLKV